VFEGSSGEGSFSSGAAGSIASSGSSSGVVPRSPVTHYALHDYYNVTAITDIGGAVVERYGYSVFGDTRYMTPGFVDRTGSFYEWDLLFKAQFRDEETGYYNYGFRYYVPLLGRWITRDPIGEEGGLNLYGYCSNDVENSNDYLGLNEEVLVLGGGLAALGAAGAVTGLVTLNVVLTEKLAQTGRETLDQKQLLRESKDEGRLQATRLALAKARKNTGANIVQGALDDLAEILSWLRICRLYGLG
jgi:RHS repeat-associated protein